MKEAKSYCVTSFGDYAEGLGTLRASGGDIGGGSEILIVYELPESDRLSEPRGASRELQRTGCVQRYVGD